MSGLAGVFPHLPLPTRAPASPGACKMLAEYCAGLHRVVFSGDFARSMEQISGLAGFPVQHEG